MPARTSAPSARHRAPRNRARHDPHGSCDSAGDPRGERPRCERASRGRIRRRQLLRPGATFLGVERGLATQGWAEARPLSAHTFELSGKTVGIVGLGDIGKRIARTCSSGLGMQVLGYQPDANRFPEFVKSVPLNTMLVRSDFVTLNCPLTASTKHLIDSNRLALMKPTAFLVNAARGEVVDEAALVQALRARTIAGAALDVYAKQPLSPDHALLAIDNVLLTIPIPRSGCARPSEPQSPAKRRPSNNAGARNERCSTVSCKRTSPPGWRYRTTLRVAQPRR